MSRENKPKQFFVEIVKHKSDEIVERMGPMPEWKADKVAAGVGINMDWDNYTVRVVEAT